MILFYKYRLYPNRIQQDALADMLGDFCALYNAGLQQRIDAWQRQGLSVTYGKQAAELKSARAIHNRLGLWSFSAEQHILRRLDN